MEKMKVLFVCIHNSARSQMAEALLNRLGGDRYEAQSAGLEPGVLNPYAVEAMAEIGIDISANKTKTVRQMLDRGTAYDYVVTVCDGASAERCPVFPGSGRRLHWDLPDPAAVTGDATDVLRRIGAIRDEIRSRVVRLLETIGSESVRHSK